MNWSIRLTTRAKSDLASIVSWYAEQDREAATKWYQGFLLSLQRLEAFPESFAVAPEAELLSLDVREYFYGGGRSKTHRVFFRVLPAVVEILAIRHRAQREVTAADLGLDE